MHVGTYSCINSCNHSYKIIKYYNVGIPIPKRWQFQIYKSMMKLEKVLTFGTKRY